MKKHLVCFAVLALCVCAFALSQTDVDFLKSLDSFTGTSLAGNYSQTKSVSGSSRSLTTTGKVLISPNDGIAWLAEKPYESKLIVSKNYLKQQIRNNPPTELAVAGNEIYTSIATALECVFFGDFDTMQKVFNATLSGNKSKWVLKLVPRDKSISSFISAIDITGSNSLESLTIFQATGDKTVYNFDSLKARELTDEEKAVYSL